MGVNYNFVNYDILNVNLKSVELTRFIENKSFILLCVLNLRLLK